MTKMHFPPLRGIGDKAYDCHQLGPDLAQRDDELIAPHRANRKPENVAQVTRTYEPNRDLVSMIENQWFENITDPNSLGLISSYTYTNDALGRRTAMGCAGDVFASPHAWAYWYNDRNELTDGTRTDVGDWAYRYDPIGNRRSASEPGAELETYSANALNQYTRTQQPLREPEVRAYEHDADGNLTRVRLAVDVAGADGLVDAGDFEFFAGCMAGPGVTTPPGGVDPDDFAACDFEGDGDVDLADFAAIPRAAGQADTGSTYTWNAENRLMSVARTYPALADPNEPSPVKVEFRYDYLGRRIEKRVLPWNPALNGGAGGWDAAHPTRVTRFVGSGWLMLLELDGLNGCGTPGAPAECVVRKYTWGLDLAGQNGQVNSLESAGAISGLLAARDAGDPGNPNDGLPLWYFYDANGNVGQVLTMIIYQGSTYGIIWAARYEYDPYGNRVNEPAENEYEQPWRFDTKQWDPETGLLYFGLRYRGRERWVNRDPLGESASLNLFGYLLDPIGGIDPLGLDDCTTCHIGLSGHQPSAPSSCVGCHAPLGFVQTAQPCNFGTLTVSAEDCCTGQAYLIAAGLELWRTGELRLAYVNEVGQLPHGQAGQVARKELRDTYRRLQTSLGKAMQRHPWFQPSGRLNNPAKTNAFVDAVAKDWPFIGKACVAVGVTLDVAAVVTAPDGARLRVGTARVAAWGGAIAGGHAGCAVGLACGPAAPVTVPAFGLCGAVAGGVGTDWVVNYLWELAQSGPIYQPENIRRTIDCHRPPRPHGT